MNFRFPLLPSGKEWNYYVVWSYAEDQLRGEGSADIYIWPNKITTYADIRSVAEHIAKLQGYPADKVRVENYVLLRSVRREASKVA